MSVLNSNVPSFCMAAANENGRCYYPSCNCQSYDLKSKIQNAQKIAGEEEVIKHLQQKGFFNEEEAEDIYDAVAKYRKDHPEKDDCSRHPKHLHGLTMEEAAKSIANLHYESLQKLLYHLSKELEADARKDYEAGKEKTAADLQYLQFSIFESCLRAEKLWQGVKPFMK